MIEIHINFWLYGHVTCHKHQNESNRCASCDFPAPSCDFLCQVGLFRIKLCNLRGFNLVYVKFGSEKQALINHVVAQKAREIYKGRSSTSSCQCMHTPIKSELMAQCVRVAILASRKVSHVDDWSVKRKNVQRWNGGIKEITHMQRDRIPRTSSTSFRECSKSHWSIACTERAAPDTSPGWWAIRKYAGHDLAQLQCAVLMYFPTFCDCNLQCSGISV